MPKRHFEGRTADDRAKIRKTLGSLKSLTVQPITRARYDQAKTAFYGWLEAEGLSIPPTAFLLDGVVSDYLEFLWASGKGRTEGSNILAALQDAQPHLKGQLKTSWRLMKTWVTHEIPNRAPPLTLDALHLLVGYALFKQWNLFALSLLLGFHGLLRTGELLAVEARHVTIAKAKGPAVISLGLTKGGKRHGAAESVTIHAEDVCRRLFQWKQLARPSASLTGPSHVWRKTFSQSISAVGLSTFDFRPYSLRRGGATNYFQIHGRFDALLVLGRWQSASTARIYVNEGLAVLSNITLPWNRFSRNLRSQYLNSLTKPLAKLELTKPTSQNRGRWKKGAKRETRGFVFSKRGGGLQMPLGLAGLWSDPYYT